MNGYSMKRRSQTDWARVDALKDSEIDLSEVPELDETFFANAILRMPFGAETVTVRVDPNVLAWFRAQGAEYEQRINAALRIYAEAHEAYSHTLVHVT